jgi:ADP-heptose:LPS heptosyltransferase
LYRLFQSLPNAWKLIDTGSPALEFDVHCPLVSLAGVFKSTLDSIPAPVPYLRADPVLVERWRSRMAHDGRLKVGLAWSGRAAHANDRNRSIALREFDELAKLAQVQWFSLQKGAAAAQAASMPWLMDLTSDLHCFADTAALIENLDLVVSVDTAVAHLAGAMGKTVWTLLPFIPDWRWMLDRADSPWYPTMRLFRQKTKGDWPSVITEVVRMLTDLPVKSSS